jgi:hypothetical protein
MTIKFWWKKHEGQEPLERPNMYKHTFPFHFMARAVKITSKMHKPKRDQMPTGCVISHIIFKTATQVKFKHQSIILKRFLKQFSGRAWPVSHYGCQMWKVEHTILRLRVP